MVGALVTQIEVRRMCYWEIMEVNYTTIEGDLLAFAAGEFVLGLDIVWPRQKRPASNVCTAEHGTNLLPGLIIMHV